MGAIRPFGMPAHVLWVQVASLGVVVVVGVGAMSKRAGAQTESRADVGSEGRGPDARSHGAAHGADVSTVDAASRDGDTAAVATTERDDSGAGGALAPSDYTVLQGPEDIPADLSDEQRRSLGVGPVPIHREGAFRSALAHPRFGPAADVRVGLVLNTVRSFDIRTGTFEADFFLSLTSDRPMPATHLTFPNGNVASEYMLVDSPTLRVWRYVVNLSTPVDLRRYPFDTQELTIEVEDQRAGVDQVVFHSDGNRTALDEGFHVAGWGVAYLGARAYRHAYPTRFDRDDLYVSRYKFVLGIDRFSTSAAFSVFVPAFIIILISLTGLWITFSRIDVRAATGAPMLAAAVLFHFSLMQALPATGYLTRADKLMLGVYFSLLLNMMSTWLFFVVRESSHNRLFIWARRLVPSITVAVMAYASLG